MRHASILCLLALALGLPCATLVSRPAAAQSLGCVGQPLEEQLVGTWLLHQEGAEQIFIMSTLSDGTIMFATYFRVDGVRDENYIRGIWSIDESEHVMRSCALDDEGVMRRALCDEFRFRLEQKNLELDPLGQAGQSFELTYLCEPIRYFASKIDPVALLEGDVATLTGAAPGGGIYGTWVFGVEHEEEVWLATLTLKRDKQYTYSFATGSQVTVDSGGTFDYNGRQLRLEDTGTGNVEIVQVKVLGDQLLYYLSPSQILPFLKIGS